MMTMMKHTMDESEQYYMENTMDDGLLDEEFIHEHDELVLELELTRNEALFIDDSLSMIIEREPSEDRMGTVRPMAHTAGLPSPVDLIEKIGKAVLYTTDSNNKGEPAKVSMSETDLYMLREITHSYVKVGDEPVGFNLKRKIYHLLYGTEYERDKVANKLIAQIEMPVAPMDDEPSEGKKPSKEK